MSPEIRNWFKGIFFSYCNYFTVKRRIIYVAKKHIIRDELRTDLEKLETEVIVTVLSKRQWNRLDDEYWVYHVISPILKTI